MVCFLCFCLKLFEVFFLLIVFSFIHSVIYAFIHQNRAYFYSNVFHRKDLLSNQSSEYFLDTFIYEFKRRKKFKWFSIIIWLFLRQQFSWNQSKRMKNILWVKNLNKIIVIFRISNDLKYYFGYSIYAYRLKSRFSYFS